MIKRFVILGALGDLASRYLLPSLATLHDTGALEPDVEIVGVALDDIDTDAYRERVREALERHASGVGKSGRETLLGSLRYAMSDVTEAEPLRAAIRPDDGPAVVYLALPPGVFAPTIQALHDVGLPEGSRIVVEKPFGDDLDSAKELNRLLHDTFPEEAVFRVDHFLGKQTVQNLLGLRFANRMFEPLWNCQHIRRVDIRWDETLALEGRAGYYDDAGALKDMLQNHLLQLLCFVAMEPPLSFGERDLRDRKADLLKAVRRPSAAEVKEYTYRARYAAGKIGDREIPAYADEDGVDPSKETETFAQATLFIDNWRWSGVPFTLRSGKALPENRREIVIEYRPVPHLPFAGDDTPQPNRLRLSFGPDRMDIELNLNGEGDPFDLEAATLGTELAPQTISAYGRLLLDVLRGDPTLSIRDDEAEESWRIVDPILEAWRAGDVPLEEYPAGSELEV